MSTQKKHPKSIAESASIGTKLLQTHPKLLSECKMGKNSRQSGVLIRKQARILPKAQKRLRTQNTRSNFAPSHFRNWHLQEALRQHIFVSKPIFVTQRWEDRHKFLYAQRWKKRTQSTYFSAWPAVPQTAKNCLREGREAIRSVVKTGVERSENICN